MITEYFFTEQHATVFSRYIRYNYKKIIETYQKYQTYLDEDEDEYYAINHANAKCRVIPECDEETGELAYIQVDIYFMRKQHRDFKYYFSFSIKLWRKCDHCPMITLDQIEEEFKKQIGKRTRVCVCDSSIHNDEMDKCEQCYLYSIVRDEACCVCLDNDYSWVKLNCNCKGGRIIHLHCFQRLPREYDDGWKTKCPCCRKKISYWGNDDIVYNPDFIPTYLPQEIPKPRE